MSTRSRPAAGGPLLKVCGARTAADVATLAAAGADLVGLWHGVGGRAELTGQELVELAAVASATGRLDPVLVTLLGDPDLVSDTAVRAGIRWVQLHGYQPPAMVRRLRARAGGLCVVKVLHIRDGRCVDAGLLPAYQRAGTDAFLIDTSAAGRIGSTGEPADPAAVLAVAAATDRPIMLAGGVRIGSAARFSGLVGHPRLLGLDVDTGGRDPAGRFDPAVIRRLRDGWREVDT